VSEEFNGRESRGMNYMLRNTVSKIKRLIRPPCKFQHSFSMEGEDGILRHFFSNKKGPGFYVDVGAHHPSRFSNTYGFYQDGWRGINIDPLPSVMESFVKIRPRDINLEIAIAEKAGCLTYYMFNEPALNTFDPVVAKKHDGPNGYKIVGTKVIQTRPLRLVLAEQLPAGQVIDFLSIDVEGFDMEVLRSNDWLRFKPEVVLAEDLDANSISQAIDSPVTRYLNSMGYELFAKTLVTMFFRRRT
jgi:FkbM family methyltransferase